MQATLQQHFEKRGESFHYMYYSNKLAKLLQGFKNKLEYQKLDLKGQLQNPNNCQLADLLPFLLMSDLKAFDFFNNGWPGKLTSLLP